MHRGRGLCVWKPPASAFLRGVGGRGRCFVLLGDVTFLKDLYNFLALAADVPLSLSVSCPHHPLSRLSLPFRQALLAVQMTVWATEPRAEGRQNEMD